MTRVGDFIIEGFIRKTKLSTVRMARSAKNGSYPVIVKEYSLRNGQQRRGYERESRVLSILQHPSIVRLYDHFEQRNKGYVVLEHLEGQTLEEQVRKSGPMKEEDAVLVGYEIANALSYLHEREDPILHRDVKPTNIMIREDGMVVLIDFNLAGCKTDELLGTCDYVAPEIADGIQDTKSDVYALGLCLLDSILAFGATPERYDDGYGIRFFSRSDLSHRLVHFSNPLVVEIEKCLDTATFARPTASELTRRFGELYGLRTSLPAV